MTCYEQEFYIKAKRELPKLVKELRRANELKALELKMRLNLPVTATEIEQIMGEE
jgi:hypothetical protein